MFRSGFYAQCHSGETSRLSKIVVIGTAGHPRVDLDAFVRLYLL